MRHDDGIVGEHLDVLFRVLALHDRIVVEGKLGLFTVFGAHDVYLFLLGVLGDTSGLGQHLQDGHIGKEGHRTDFVYGADEVNLFAADLTDDNRDVGLDDLTGELGHEDLFQFRRRQPEDFDLFDQRQGNLPIGPDDDTLD